MTTEDMRTCDNCKQDFDRSLLTVKRVQFVEPGDRNPRQLKVRTIAWLCPECIAADEHWQLAPAVPRGKRARTEPRPKAEPRPHLRAQEFDEPDLHSALEVGSPWQTEDAGV